MIPKNIRISHSVRKLLRHNQFQLTKNTAFAAVITHCRHIPRHGQDGTWITSEMEQAYISLHHAGYANSYEAWRDGELVGGLYGVNIGHAFFGESMFALTPNASKAAFAHMIDDLIHIGITLCDCQVANQHTLSLGAKEVSRAEYLQLLHHALQT
jgi:leucyl/phenylalanyl-tRNA--protein transferase